jgi:2-keto-4-pentenoate hydratase
MLHLYRICLDITSTLASPTDASLKDGLRRQQEEFRHLVAEGAGRLGWKAGFGTAAAIQKLGTSGPLAAPLTDSTLVSSGTSIDVKGWSKPVLEAEVAVRLATDVVAGQGRAEIEAAIGAVGAAIELVDLGEAGDDAGAILAAGIFHRAVILGEMRPPAPGTSLGDVRIDVFYGQDPYAVNADPSALLDDLTEVLRGMATLLLGTEDGLRAGDVVITGAAVKPVALTGGEEISVRIDDSDVLARIL